MIGFWNIGSLAGQRRLDGVPNDRLPGTVGEEPSARGHGVRWHGTPEFLSSGMAAARDHRLSSPRLAPGLPGALVVSLLALGCARGAGTVIPELTPWNPPEGQTCSAAGGKFALDALLDSVAAVRAVEALGPVDGALLLSTAVDSAGAVSRFHRIETTLPESGAEAVATEIRRLVRGNPPGPRLGRILLVITEGRVTTLRSGASRACGPVILNEPAVQRALRAQHWTLGRAGSAVLWLFVDRAGSVARSRVEVSSGDPDLDRALLEAGRTARFLPALIDREPVAMWVQIQLALEPDCPPRMASERTQLPYDHPCRDASFRIPAAPG